MMNRRSSNFGFRRQRSRRPLIMMVVFIVLALIAASVSYIYWQKNKELMEQYEEEKIEEEVDLLGNFIVELEQTVSSGIEEGDFIPYGGGLYDLMEDKWLSVSDVLPGSEDFEDPVLFYTDRCLFGYTKDGSFNVTDGSRNTSTFSTKEEAEKEYYSTYGQEFESGDLLVRGDEDRRLIAETIRTEEKAKVLVYIRYLVSNGTDAFLISSPGEDTQTVDQYYFRKNDGEWKILGKAVADQGYDYLNTIDVSDFSLSLLPDYRVKDHAIYKHSDAELYTLMETLRSEGAAETQDAMNYVSHVDNYVFVLVSSGNRVLVKTTDGEGLEVESIEVLDSELGYASYHSLIDGDYQDRPAPYFLFLQN